MKNDRCATKETKKQTKLKDGEFMYTKVKKPNTTITQQPQVACMDISMKGFTGKQTPKPKESCTTKLQDINLIPKITDMCQQMNYTCDKVVPHI